MLVLQEQEPEGTARDQGEPARLLAEEFGPPPNPTKLSDSRAQGYIERFGYECWELDALDPSVISRLIDENVRMYRDEGLYRDVLMRENEEKGTLRDLRDGYQGLIQNWSEICENYDIYQ